MGSLMPGAEVPGHKSRDVCSAFQSDALCREGWHLGEEVLEVGDLLLHEEREKRE